MVPRLMHIVLLRLDVWMFGCFVIHVKLHFVIMSENKLYFLNRCLCSLQQCCSAQYLLLLQLCHALHTKAMKCVFMKTSPGKKKSQLSDTTRTFMTSPPRSQQKFRIRRSKYPPSAPNIIAKGPLVAKLSTLPLVIKNKAHERQKAET